MRESIRVVNEYMAETNPVTLIGVPCDVCEHEVPASEAVVAEAVDYVLYFCGFDCFQRWYRQAARDAASLESAHRHHRPLPLLHPDALVHPHRQDQAGTGKGGRGR